MQPLSTNAEHCSMGDLYNVTRVANNDTPPPPPPPASQEPSAAAQDIPPPPPAGFVGQKDANMEPERQEDEAQEEAECEVEAILASRGLNFLSTGGILKVEYCVKWVDDDQPTWEPAENLLRNAADVVADFHHHLPGSIRPAGYQSPRGWSPLPYYFQPGLKLASSRIKVKRNERKSWGIWGILKEDEDGARVLIAWKDDSKTGERFKPSYESWDKVNIMGQVEWLSWKSKTRLSERAEWQCEGYPDD
ncbi:Hypothetical predicted protein [Lecanosticta acicola]|uniref:Chromo domain-containing protein n=1 Tax=Lecanosticta acicola TaxID=111012 RepID=A0AAI9EDX4_9PEZI|nr:Hypothetical predicted protein [Lecanosticta acicola]